MEELTDEDYAAACERGRIEFETKPHAASARFDRRSGMVILELYNGCAFSFPARELQGLEDASDAQLAEVEVIAMGFGVHWEQLDADFTVPGLMAGRFGNAAHMAPRHAKLRAILDRTISDRRDAA